MAKFNRRDFIKNLTACACGTTISKGLLPFSDSLAFAQSNCSSNRKVLVSIFLAGGPHGPSILVPRNTQAYFDKHPLVGIENSLFLDNTHGLHPEMVNLHNLYNEGKLALMNGGGYPGHSRSHADSTDLMGRGIFNNRNEGTGWAGRFVKNYCSPNEVFSLFSFRGNISETKAPGVTPPSATDLNSFGFGSDSVGSGTGRNENNAFIRQVIAENRLLNKNHNPHQQELLKSWETAESAVSRIAQINSGYSSSVTYPGGLGTRLRDAAKLILSPLVSVKNIFVSQGGYDTHGNQNNNLPGLLRSLDLSISAFWQDMVAAGRDNDVVVVFYGEFGRTHQNNNVDQNGNPSPGTDHGTGTFIGVLGNNVRGGVLSPAYTNADFTAPQPWVPVKFDYREVMSQIFARHLSVDPGPIFPEAFNKIGINLFR